MKALILAAGLGSRLKHVTTDIPKALVPVAGKPILFYQLEALVQNNIKDVSIVLGYNGHRIIEYLEKETFPLSIEYFTNNEFDSSNSSYSFWLAHEKFINSSYIHMNCDIIFNPSLMKKIIHSPHDNIIAIRKDVPLGGRLEHVSLDHDRIIDMSITQIPSSLGKAFGLAKFSPESTALLSTKIKSFLEKGDKNQNYYGMIRSAVKEIPYYAFDAVDELLLEVNTLEDLERVERIIQSHHA